MNWMPVVPTARLGRLLLRAAFVWAATIGGAILALFGRPTPARRDVDHAQLRGDE